MQIIDNFLDEQTFLKTAESILTLPWFYSPSKTGSANVDELWNQQMAHTFYYKTQAVSKHQHLLEPFTNYFKPEKYLRVKANLTMPSNALHLYNMHYDQGQSYPYTTAIFYLNTNNGRTVFETGEQVDSIENRLVIFDGHTKHAGTTHTDKKFRCVINFNWV